MRAAKVVLAIGALSFAAHAEPWQRHTIDDSSRGADGVRLGDINGDGLQDIATAWEEGGVVRVTINPGADRAKERWPGVTVGRVKSGEDAVFADLDNNGQLDVVSACEGGTRSIFVHWAPEDEADLMSTDAWKTEVLPASENAMQFMFILPMAVNDDGRIDLVTGAKNEGAALGWFDSPQDPRDLSQWRWHSIAPVGWVMSIRAIDLNGDGRQDVMVSDRRSDTRGIHGWLRPEAVHQKWDRTTFRGPTAEFMFLDAGPHGAGLFDIAWAERGTAVQWIRVEALVGNMSQRSRSFAMPPNTGTGKAAALGDLNGDGLTDLVVSCEHAANAMGVFAYLHPADGDWEAGDWSVQDISGWEGTKFDRMELIDLDGDGDLDVLTCEERENLGVIWYENPQ
jgi:hypothetical protein